MTSYSLRPAQARDFDFMQATKFVGLRPYVDATLGWDQRDQEQRFRQNFDAAASQIIVWQDQDVGYVQVEDQPNAAFIAGIYVAPQFQRRGIGTSVVRDLVRALHANGKGVTLRVLRSNPAKALYTRLGFHVVSETSTHFEMRASRDDALIESGT